LRFRLFHILVLFIILLFIILFFIIILMLIIWKHLFRQYNNRFI